MPADFTYIADTHVRLLRIPPRAFFPMAAMCSLTLTRALIQLEQYR